MPKFSDAELRILFQLLSRLENSDDTRVTCLGSILEVKKHVAVAILERDNDAKA